MSNQNIFYNYIYLDPRKPGKYTYENLNFCLLYEPFYVGKGKGRRYLDHIKEAKKQESKNLYKINKINKILELNYNLEDYILRLNFTNNEKEVLDYEIELIEEIGLENLTNIAPGGNGISGMVNCKDKEGNKFYITKEEFDNNPNLVSVNKGTLPYKNIITGEIGRISKEEFDNNPDLVHINKGISLSEETKKKMSQRAIGRMIKEETKIKISTALKNIRKDSQIGSKNNKAKRINIYNERDELMFECHGNFKQVCLDNNLPLGYLKRCYQNNIKIEYIKKDLTKSIKNGNIKYQGWYAIKK